jgi:hypothetical protein
MPIDSGAPRVIFEGGGPNGNPIPVTAAWGSDGRVYLLTRTGPGLSRLLVVDPATGRWAPRVEFDPATHAVFGRLIRVVKEALFFATESRESDVWVFDVTSR